MFNSTDHITICYFSGYIRNWRRLCEELSIGLPLSREDREQAILKAAYAKWGVGLTEHLYGMFAISIWDMTYSSSTHTNIFTSAAFAR